MKVTQTFENRKVLVLGLAKSGMSATKLLQKLGAIITVNDYKPLEENPDARDLLNDGIKVITGGHPRDLMEENFEFVVKNPGIPYSNPIVKDALEKNIPIISEVELGLLVNEAKYTAITGSNGKTTTTTLIHKIYELNKSLGRSFVGGNIGIPVSEVVQEAKKSDNLVLELSSFQLLATPSLKPEIALITNIYSAHLDYHKTRENYVEAKLNITANQSDTDYLVYNADQDELSTLVKERSKAQLVPFSRTKEQKEGSWTDGRWIYFKEEKVLENDLIKLVGNHNLENILAAVATAKIKKIDNEYIRKAIENFYGVSHRCEFIKEFKSVKYINDSKATNVLATEQALNGLQKNIILICGGLDRGEDFEELSSYFRDKVKALVTLGQTAEKFQKLGKATGISQITEVDSIQEAVLKSNEWSQPGDTVLLSPACASWDQYSDFEERGRLFIEEVNKL